ncbi:hypothetical protein BC831DRAFT_506552 [Entophlyctis helioformis]|nr:hypothetical protein BC831DRAFT_506552 [Entophlyctis helioformis]
MTEPNMSLLLAKGDMNAVAVACKTNNDSLTFGQLAACARALSMSLATGAGSASPADVFADGVTNDANANVNAVQAFALAPTATMATDVAGEPLGPLAICADGSIAMAVSVLAAIQARRPFAPVAPADWEAAEISFHQQSRGAGKPTLLAHGTARRLVRDSLMRSTAASLGKQVPKAATSPASPAGAAPVFTGDSETMRTTDASATDSDGDITCASLEIDGEMGAGESHSASTGDSNRVRPTIYPGHPAAAAGTRTFRVYQTAELLSAMSKRLLFSGLFGEREQPTDDKAFETVVECLQTLAIGRYTYEAGAAFGSGSGTGDADVDGRGSDDGSAATGGESSGRSSIDSDDSGPPGLPHWRSLFEGPTAVVVTGKRRRNIIKNIKKAKAKAAAEAKLQAAVAASTATMTTDAEAATAVGATAADADVQVHVAAAAVALAEDAVADALATDADKAAVATTKNAETLVEMTETKKPAKPSDPKPWPAGNRRCRVGLAAETGATAGAAVYPAATLE